MKWFDSLLSSKQSRTSLKENEDVAKNISHKSYRDIKKRPPILSLTQGIFDPKKSYTPFSFRRNIQKLCLGCDKVITSCTRVHWSVVLILILLAYLIYGLGFLIRTEVHLDIIRDNPGILITSEGLETLRSMRKDYQVIAPIVQNPFFPIEPLATYGKVLRIGYDMLARMGDLNALETGVMEWKNTAETVSVFPLVDEVFLWLDSLDSDVQKLHTMIQARVPEIDDSIVFTLWNNALQYRDTWYTLLGKNGPTRILLLNQNSDELRAGGGFPGTAFIIEFDAGKMTRFQFNDIYALDWHLQGYRPSPEGINQFRSIQYPGKPVEFEIRDANYYPRFRDSAVKLNELAQDAGIGSLDLVIGINQKFLEDIVRLVEPLDIPGIPLPIDHKNVTLILSMLVEGKKTLEGTPKGTVKILADSLLHELQAQNKEKQAALILASHIYHGEFVAGSRRFDVQKTLDSLGLFDRWQNKEGDWVYPLFTSISRNKSDRLMERTFEINHINQCERTLTLRQKHWFDLIEASRIRSLAHELGLDDKIQTLLPIQGGGDNVQYLRFILPPGTKLLPKSDSRFSIIDANSIFTTVHGYETTKPGTTKSMTLKYVLPEGYCEDSTEFFKQPGLRNTRIVIQQQGEDVYQKFYE